MTRGARLPRTRLAVLVTALFLLAGHARARAWTVPDLPSPQSDAKGVCGRDGKKSAVCDPDGVLSRDEADVVDGLANFIAEGSHGFALVDCGGTRRGYQVAVAVFHRMERDGWKSASSRVRDFAKGLHDSWGVGDAECNNGVVLVVVLDERVMYISTGRGAKGVLTHKKVEDVLDDMKQMLRDERIGAALQRGVTDIGKVLAGGRTVGDEESLKTAKFVVPPMLMMVLGVICCGACGAFPPTPRQRYQRCQRVLRDLDADREAARRNVYEATTCPICLEDFESEKDRKKRLRRESRLARRASRTSSSASASGAFAAAAAAAGMRAGSGDGSGGDSGDAPLLPINAPEKDEEQTSAAAAAAPPTLTTADLPSDEAALPCGHRFHRKCIASLAAAQHDACPVCRAPIEAGDGAADGTRGAVRARAPSDWDGFYPEYRYRLHRVHDLYPMYVTGDMVDRWGRHDHNERLHNDTQFTSLEPPLIESARASGAQGSSFSFGGGSSFGGGGGGSSW